MTYRLHRHRLNAARLALAQNIAIYECLAQQPGPILDSIATRGPRIDKHLQRLTEAIRRTDGEADISAAFVGHVWVQVLRSKLLDEREQGRVALRRTVLQGRSKVNLACDIGGG